MPLWNSGAVFNGFGIRFPYSQPPKDPITGAPPSGCAFNSISRSGSSRTILAVLEQRITPPNISVMLRVYDPVVAALLAGES